MYIQNIVLWGFLAAFRGVDLEEQKIILTVVFVWLVFYNLQFFIESLRIALVQRTRGKMSKYP